jgi:RHS repeat-associated protein
VPGCPSSSDPAEITCSLLLRDGECKSFSGNVLQQVSNTFDVFGNRIAQSVNSGSGTTTQKFVYSDTGLYADLDGSGNVQTRYVSDVRGPDSWLARVSAGGGGAWLLSDHLGSVRVVAGLTGGVLDEISYDAFGKITSETDPAQGGRLKYAGGELDAVTGSYHFGERDYSPTTQRWQTQDSLGLAAGPNPYQYVGNAPTDGTDPTGQHVYLHFNDPKTFGTFDTGLREAVAKINEGRADKVPPIGPPGVWFSGAITGPQRPKAYQVTTKVEDKTLQALQDYFKNDSTGIWPKLLAAYKNPNVDYWIGSPAEGKGLVLSSLVDHGNVTTVNGLTVQESANRLGEMTKAAVENTKDWWLNASVFLTKEEATKVGEALKPVEGNEGYYNLFVENLTLVLRKPALLDEYYLIGAHPSDFYSGTRTNLKIEEYETNQFLRFLAYSNAALKVTAGFLPFGTTASLLIEGKWDTEEGRKEIYKSALFDAAFALPGIGSAVKGAGMVRAITTGSTKLLQAGRAIAGVGALANLGGAAWGIHDIYRAIQRGNYTAGSLLASGGQVVLMLLGARSGYNTWTKCFPAGTPVRTPEGSRPIETLRPGDMVLSQPEDDPEAPVERRVIERVFVHESHLVRVRVADRVIRCTPDHPFYVRGQGWTGAGDLREGDAVRTESGGWVPVQMVEAEAAETAVYNVEVLEYHTYFVGSEEWGFAVWVHNNDCKDLLAKEAARLQQGLEKAAAGLGGQDLNKALERLTERAGGLKTALVGRTDVKGLENKVFEAGSAKVRQALGVEATAGPIRAPYPPNDPRYAMFVGHAEEEFGNQFLKALQDVGYKPNAQGIFADPSGHALLLINNPAGVCNKCTLDVFKASEKIGVVKQLTNRVPNVTFSFEVSGGGTKPLVIKGGNIVNP